MSFYSESGGKGDIITTQEDAVKIMIEKLEIVEQILPMEYEKILGNEKLLALVSEILQIIKNNASIDWMIKENVRARLRVAVKRVLNKYGYPPDIQQLAIDGVLTQAEILAKELVGE